MAKIKLKFLLSSQKKKKIKW